MKSVDGFGAVDKESLATILDLSGERCRQTRGPREGLVPILGQKKSPIDR